MAHSCFAKGLIGNTEIDNVKSLLRYYSLFRWRKTNEILIKKTVCKSDCLSQYMHYYLRTRPLTFIAAEPFHHLQYWRKLLYCSVFHWHHLSVFTNITRDNDVSCLRRFNNLLIHTWSHAAPAVNIYVQFLVLKKHHQLFSHFLAPMGRVATGR